MKKEAKHLNQEKEYYLKNNFINEFSGKQQQFRLIQFLF